MGCHPTFYPTDSFGAVSDSNSKIILINATLSEGTVTITLTYERVNIYCAGLEKITLL